MSRLTDAMCALKRVRLRRMPVAHAAERREKGTTMQTMTQTESV